jgi:hypothetical protein
MSDVALVKPGIQNRRSARVWIPGPALRAVPE